VQQIQLTMYEKAKSQMESFGVIRITYYFDRTYHHSEERVFKSYKDACEFINMVVCSNNEDDIHVPHANYF